jgi:hypothetical protein
MRSALDVVVEQNKAELVNGMEQIKKNIERLETQEKAEASSWKSTIQYVANLTGLSEKEMEKFRLSRKRICYCHSYITYAKLFTHARMSIIWVVVCEVINW